MLANIYNFIFYKAEIKCIQCSQVFTVSKNHLGYTHNMPTACSHQCQSIYNHNMLNNNIK